MIRHNSSNSAVKMGVSPLYCSLAWFGVKVAGDITEDIQG